MSFQRKCGVSTYCLFKCAILGNFTLMLFLIGKVCLLNQEEDKELYTQEHFDCSEGRVVNQFTGKIRKSSPSFANCTYRTSFVKLFWILRHSVFVNIADPKPPLTRESILQNTPSQLAHENNMRKYLHYVFFQHDVYSVSKWVKDLQPIRRQLLSWFKNSLSEPVKLIFRN